MENSISLNIEMKLLSFRLEVEGGYTIFQCLSLTLNYNLSISLVILILHWTSIACS